MIRYKDDTFKIIQGPYNSNYIQLFYTKQEDLMLKTLAFGSSILAPVSSYSITVSVAIGAGDEGSLGETWLVADQIKYIAQVQIFGF